MFLQIFYWFIKELKSIQNLQEMKKLQYKIKSIMPIPMLQNSSTKNSSEESTTITSKKKQVLLTQIPTLLISEKALNKIKHLVIEFNPVEWSGITFLKVEGSVEDAANLKLTLVDFVLLDIGTAGYTEFDASLPVMTRFLENHVEEYIMDNSIKTGILHSHNNMETFFSGTDTTTLLEKAVEHSFFTSLIVNNKLDKIAKISYVGKMYSIEKFYNRSGGIMLPYTREVEQDVVFVLECKVILENEGYPDKDLQEQISVAKTLKKEREVILKPPLYDWEYPKKFDLKHSKNIQLGAVHDESDFQFDLFGDERRSKKEFHHDRELKETVGFSHKKTPSIVNFTEKCFTFLKKVMCVDYAGTETKDLTLAEMRKFQLDFYEDCPVDEYLDEVDEEIPDMFELAFDKELNVNRHNPENTKKLCKLIMQTLLSILGEPSSIERQVLEKIDYYIKTVISASK